MFHSGIGPMRLDTRRSSAFAYQLVEPVVSLIDYRNRLLPLSDGISRDPRSTSMPPP